MCDNKYTFSYVHEVDSHITITHFAHIVLCATRHEESSRKPIIFSADSYF